MSKLMVVLACLVLAGCVTSGDGHCTFGGTDPASDAACAAKNFRADDAMYLREREQVCKACLDAVTPEIQQYCVLNCN